MIEGKGLGGKNINRTNLRLTNAYDLKLKSLARSVNMKPAELSRYIVERFLDNSKMVHDLQEEYCLYEAYRVRLVTMNGTVKYQLGERYDR